MSINNLHVLRERAMKKQVCIICPCHNEEKNLDLLVQSIKKISDTLSLYQINLLLVDDGSSDDTVTKIKKLAQENDFLKYIILTRNFSHQNALLAGLHKTKSDIVITMDADLQHPPKYIPNFLELHEKGFEIVNAIRKLNKGFSFKQLSSKLFYKFINSMSDIRLEANAPDFRLYGPKILAEIRKYNEKDLFLRGYVNWLGFSHTSFFYEQAARNAGETSYTFTKMLKFAINGITSMSAKPLKWIAVSGLALISIPVCYSIYLLFLYFVHPEKLVAGWLSLIMFIVFFQGITFLFLGIIAAYLSQIYNESKNRPNYIIDESNL
jgi:glycosyltransferase involved in cell wall biosynthesis